MRRPGGESDAAPEIEPAACENCLGPGSYRLAYLPFAGKEKPGMLAALWRAVNVRAVK